MCFSAEASFAASGLLAVGSVAISKIPKEKESVPLSIVPAAFALHQFIEGCIWLVKDGTLPDTFTPVLSYSYAFIAYILWPILIPFTMMFIEKERWRRMVIVSCQIIGLTVGGIILLGMLLQPVSIIPDCCHISYTVLTPPWILAPYLITVSIPFLVSVQRSLVTFGAGVVISCAITAFTVSVGTFPSVWCFFAALLSGGLFLHFRITEQNASHQSMTNAQVSI